MFLWEQDANTGIQARSLVGLGVLAVAAAETLTTAEQALGSEAFAQVAREGHNLAALRVPGNSRRTVATYGLQHGLSSTMGSCSGARTATAAAAAAVAAVVAGTTLVSGRRRCGRLGLGCRGIFVGNFQARAGHLHLLGRASAGSSTSDLESEDSGELARRGLIGTAAVAVLAAGTDAVLRASDERYAALGTILAPAPYKETLRTELVPGRIWGFEQCIALASVSTNIRMTAVRLRDGSLWVSAPISPTRQCLRSLDELGRVSHIVIPSDALEHKASLGEFARIYPDASIWVTPGQSGFPLGVPSNSKVLGQGPPPPWADELDCKLFFVEPPVTETFAEAAFFHRDTATLLVTDCALKLPATVPRILESYGYDGTPGPISPEQWRYKAIAFDFVTARGKDEADFDALSKPPAIVNPLLRFLVYRRCPQQAAAWVQDVARWPFTRIVPAHLQAPFDCTPTQFLDAFGFLFGKTSSWEPEDEQLAFLRFLRQQVGGPEF